MTQPRNHVRAIYAAASAVSGPVQGQMTALGKAKPAFPRQPEAQLQRRLRIDEKAPAYARCQHVRRSGPLFYL